MFIKTARGPVSVHGWAVPSLTAEERKRPGGHGIHGWADITHPDARFDTNDYDENGKPKESDDDLYADYLACKQLIRSIRYKVLADQFECTQIRHAAGE